MDKIKPQVLVFALVAVAIAVGLAFWFWPPPQPNTPPPSRAEPIRPEIQEKIASTLKLHSSKKWQQAVSEWETLLTDDSLNKAEFDEVRRNFADALVKQNEADPIPTDRLLSRTTLPPPKESPAKFGMDGEDPTKVFKAYYPVGRRVGLGAFVANGSGSNTGWILKGSVNFAYRYQVIAETEVLSNNGHRATFHISFPEVTQVLGISEEEFEFHIPQEPIVKFVWELATQSLDKIPTPDLSLIIVKGLIKEGIRQAPKLDPGLKKTATYTAEKLKHWGWIPNDLREDQQLVAKIESLSGQELEVTYVRDMGITEIKVCKGTKMTNEMLENIAYNSSLLMDYYLFPSDTKQKGDQWDVAVRDVSGLANLGYDVVATGTLTLRYKDDSQVGETKVVQLEIIAGEAEGTVKEKEGTKRFTISPQSGGILEYEVGSKILKTARLKWVGNMNSVSEKHLLHGTKSTSASLETYYESYRADRKLEEGKPAGCANVEP